MGEHETPAEKRRLEKQKRRGAAAKNQFVQANLRLVVHNARRYQGVRGIDFLDLVQEGNLGLIRAVEKFDWRKGFKFSHLRHLVDKTGHHPGHRRQIPHRADSRPIFTTPWPRYAWHRES